MLVLEGCVQPTLAPNINAATARILDKLGISLIKAPKAGCCGAVSYHLNAQQEGLDYMRRNVDAWWPYVGMEDDAGGEGAVGVEAIVMTASGCGVTVKEYGHLLRHDPAYAEKAARISELTKDISEIWKPRPKHSCHSSADRWRTRATQKNPGSPSIPPVPCNTECEFGVLPRRFWLPQVLN